MATETDSSARHQDRYSHISIPLQCRCGDTWEHLQALGWNAQGFNFYHPQPIEAQQLEFKRGLAHFGGTVVWSAIGTDEAAVREAVVNELLFKRAGDVVKDPALQARLLKLIRQHGMLAQKHSVLAALGLDIPNTKMAALLARRIRERPLLRYGVRVESAQWAMVVAKALSLSAVVVSLEHWSLSLRQK